MPCLLATARENVIHCIIPPILHPFSHRSPFIHTWTHANHEHHIPLELRQLYAALRLIPPLFAMDTLHGLIRKVGVVINVYVLLGLISFVLHMQLLTLWPR